MPVRLQNLVLDIDEPGSLLAAKAAARLGIDAGAIRRLVVVRRSLDARGREPRLVFTVEVALADPKAEAKAIAAGQAIEAKQAPSIQPHPGEEPLQGRVVVIGCGPAGLFAALLLARYGYRPLILERGAPPNERQADVARFLSTRQLHPDSNILFGAGGAGTFSDGKLYSRIHDPRVSLVMEALVAAGAPSDLPIDARPHLGTDLLGGVVANLCSEIARLGAEIHWRTRVTGLVCKDGTLCAIRTASGTIPTNAAILAAGAYARDTFADMLAAGLSMEAKPFQMGLRIEHPRELIDRAVYGKHAGNPRLGAASYVLSGASVTAFCVCPGGVLVPACSEPETVCTNGMSARARDSAFTNAALVTTVTPAQFGAGPLAGLEFQRRWEREAFRLGGADYAAPAQMARDFLTGSISRSIKRTTYPFGVRPARLADVLPSNVWRAVARALPLFERRIPGFAGDEAILVGPETRASCPVRILRHPTRRTSLAVDGIYPSGEGSGYSSGIMSSAVDGIRAAEAIIARFAPPRG